MKILCDVCERHEASVFCTADEAALCKSCDHGVHHANKLASKHQRFSLLQPSSKQLPLCDICLERRGFLFCQQDRVILCRECDTPIHSTNKHTQKHHRFLLTGLKLSTTTTSYSSSPSAANVIVHTPDPVPQCPKSRPFVKNSLFGAPPETHPPISANTTIISMPINKTLGNIGDETEVTAGPASSIAEYLIETLPGWHVEDFLDSSATPSEFCSKIDDGMLTFIDTGVESNLGSLAQQRVEAWVPQAPTSHHLSHMGGQDGFNFTKETPNVRATAPNFGNDSFRVPQISAPAAASSRKRSRPLW